MFNKIKHTVQEGTHKFIKSIAITGTALLILLKPGVSKGNEAVKDELQKVLKEHSVTEWKIQESTKDDGKTAKFEAVKDTINALDFAVKNVDKYYPDMKEHVDSLINSFRDQEQKDTVNFLFQEHIFKNIKDEKKQVASIIYCIESLVFDGDSKVSKLFSKTYKIGTIIAKEEYKYLFDFDKRYNKRFKGYYMKLEQTIITMKEQNEKMKEQNEKMKEQNEKMKKELEQLKLENQQLKKETEGIINTFTANDVKTNPQVKKLVLDVEELYIFAEYEIYPHLAELIKTAKQ